MPSFLSKIRSRMSGHPDPQRPVTASVPGLFNRRRATTSTPQLLAIELLRPATIPQGNTIAWQKTAAYLEDRLKALVDDNPDRHRRWYWTHELSTPLERYVSADKEQWIYMPSRPEDFQDTDLFTAFENAFTSLDLPVDADGRLYWVPEDPRVDYVFILQFVFPGLLRVVTMDNGGERHASEQADMDWIAHWADKAWLEAVDERLAQKVKDRANPVQET